METQDDFYKSRSQKKRESTALQGLGEDLAKLPPAVLRSLDLPEALLAALLELPRLKSHEAKRRQMQFVGKLMREIEDPTALVETLAARKRG